MSESCLVLKRWHRFTGVVHVTGKEREGGGGVEGWVGGAGQHKFGAVIRVLVMRSPRWAFLTEPLSL